MDNDEDPARFWERQSRLPPHKRDGMWWASVGFSHVVVALLAAGVAFIVVKAILGAIL